MSQLVSNELDLAKTTLAKIFERNKIFQAESLLWLHTISFT